MWDKVKALLAWLLGTKEPDTPAPVSAEELAAERNRADKAEARAEELAARLENVIQDAQRYEAQLLAGQKIIDRYFT
ncbi:hypothetical protein LJC60_04880 [Ruminococcaceae bacterium OttesenSCG-928-D13]|nr:hypothetical protein [Ruminococcaceae bacterium OttesenSCG-928-D13]